MKALHDTVASGEATPTARVNAARAILDLAVHFHEVDDLEARIEAVEPLAQRHVGRAA